jgi:hypothetical protein
MRRNEAIVFKCYDSERDGRARWTAHCAFDDPTSSPDAPPRRRARASKCVPWRFFDFLNYRYAMRAECGAEFRLPVRWLCLILREASSTELRFRENRLFRGSCILRARRFLGFFG